MKFGEIFGIAFTPRLQIIDVLISNFIHDLHIRTRKDIENLAETTLDTYMCFAIFDNTGETWFAIFR